MDSVKIDSIVKSALVGRVAGAILFIGAMVLQAYGYTLSLEDQKALVDAISMIAGSIGTVLVLISKLRETKRNMEK